VTAAAPSPIAALEIEAVSMTKRFGPLLALDEVSTRVHAGSFHALLGENGAGKSTLVKCVMGYHRPDAGKVLVGGREQQIDSPRAAHALGLGMVYQHFTLVPNMTVAENLILARAKLPAVIDWRAERESLQRFLSLMPFRVPLEAPVATLAAGEKQKVEILKQLYLERRFLVLDEPTSVLTPGEADEILGLLRGMARSGALTVLLITHKFREVLAFADEVTVLRRGRRVGGGSVAQLTPDKMARMMVGSQELPAPARRNGEPGKPRLSIAGLQALDDLGNPGLTGVDLTVRGGEIVGIAGVSGNGQRELVEVLAGQRLASAGEVRVDGRGYRATREEMRNSKFSCLPEEPLRNACVAGMSVAENLTLREFDLPPFARGGFWLEPSAFRAAAEKKIARYGIKARSPEVPIRQLSGGNVQRAVLARELGGDVDLLVAANPCFGLDFAAVAQIHAQIMEARNRGAAVLLVSEDLDELLELSDRILVMFDGGLVYETPAASADLTEIGRRMAGH
jgi:simple sugar transport system ATP-binding protein